ncbi:PGPGW domain-containing protein [Rhodospirillum sp. A1_3_36]|uniref:PGPGW domain-containing protein n=1 Tax=Rhodospirillum sp. A1_3_36 TaxID=3391666 RepID=UPI0039A51F4E
MTNGIETATVGEVPPVAKRPSSGTFVLFFRRRRRRLYVFTQRSLRQVVGWSLIFLGVIVAPTPLPLGLLLMAVGLYMVARDSVVARRMVRWIRRHISPLNKGLEALHPRVSKGMRVFIERTHPDRGD